MAYEVVKKHYITLRQKFRYNMIRYKLFDMIDHTLTKYFFFHWNEWAQVMQWDTNTGNQHKETDLITYSPLKSFFILF